MGRVWTPQQRGIWTPRSRQRGFMFCSSYAFGAAVTDPNFSSVGLFIPYEGSNGSTTFLDRGPAARTVTNNNTATISTAVTQFGNPTGSFDVAGGRYLSVAHATAFEFGSGDFTIEAFVRFKSFGSSFRAIASMWKTSGGTDRSWWLGTIETTGTKRLEFDLGDGTTGITSLVGTTALSAGVMYFVQARRSGTTIELRLNSALEASNGSYSATVNAGSLEVKVGASLSAVPAADSFADLYMSNLRITKGVARSTAVPTAEFPRS